MTKKTQTIGITNLPGDNAFRKFDYASMPTNIADQMRAAADHVRKLQRCALIDIGGALLGVRHRIGDEQFVGWLQGECKIPAWLAQHAMDTAEASISAGLLASAIPASDPVSVDLAEAPRRPRKPEEAKERNAAGPWVVTQDKSRSDDGRARQQQEQREWGGEANLRQHHTVLAAKILEQRLGSKLDKFLAAVSKADLDGVLGLLRGSPQAAARATAAAAPVRHAADEPPLPFMAVPDQAEAENTSTLIGARAAPMRQQTRPEPIQLKHRQPPQLHLAYGEMRDRCIAALRDGGAITAAGVVVEMMRDKSLDPARHQDLRSDLIKRALRSLHDLERHGRVARIGKGRGVRWALIVP